uniref:t-SNARE coiled-coil homology domain-containing protein n=1 Tax=Tetranychus urticae TaxID=32264 RepID=T1KUW1_TETUR
MKQISSVVGKCEFWDKVDFWDRDTYAISGTGSLPKVRFATSEVAEISLNYSELTGEAESLISDVEELLEMVRQQEDQISQKNEIIDSAQNTIGDQQHYIAYVYAELNKGVGIPRQEFPASSRSL